jgi:hypothetical protein
MQESVPNQSLHGEPLQVGAAGDPARVLPVIAVENQALRRGLPTPPSPGVIRATASYRFDNELAHATVAIAAAPSLSAPAGLI